MLFPEKTLFGINKPCLEEKKMWKKIVFAVVCMVLSAGGLAQAEAQNQSAAMIVSSAELSAGFDQAMHDRLVALGYDVTVVPSSDIGSAFTIADADAVDLLLVSESIGSSSADPLVGTTAPVMHNEAYGWGNWFFSTEANTAWSSGDTVNIVNTAHPIAAMAGVQMGPMTFFSSPASWTRDSVGALAPGADLIAQINDAGTDCAIIFAIEEGAQLTNGSAALRRSVGFSIPGDNSYDASVMTDEAWALFDAAIAWLTRSASPVTAKKPSPVDTGADVPRDIVLSWTPGEYPMMTHNVYFSTNFDDVNDGVALVSPGQDANSYDPGRLEFDQRYFWRIDEVNATDGTIYTGDLWSFSVEPFARPIPGQAISATASSNSPDQGPEKTVDRSGLDANDLHSTQTTDMWISQPGEPNSAWIQYEFNVPYKLHQMLVWNYNGQFLLAGTGMKDVAIEYSTDGVNWILNNSVSVFNKAPGTDDYASDITVDFDNAVAKFVKITATSNWIGFVAEYGLSEVQFLYIPLSARIPVPDDGATEVAIDVSLNWKAGREAAEHKVYLSADSQSVENSTAPAETVLETSYGPLSLDLGQTYYWRVDEVNNANAVPVWEGSTWSFTTKEYLVVEDFESYNDIEQGDESNLVYATWSDGGYGETNDPTNGSTIGYLSTPSMETTIVHSGRQSVPVMYDNTAANKSEVTVNTADLPIGRDWTVGSPATLSLWFYGDPNNPDTEQMYVKVNGAKAIYDGDLTQTEWQEFSVDLASLGIDLTNVTSLTIGFERIGASGGSGMVLLDDIRLYKTPLSAD